MEKRLGIFVIYDEQGIIDDYVVYLLKEMKKNLQTLIIVCNGAIGKEGITKLKQYADRVYFRENSGYDFAAYKIALEEYLGWQELYKYDCLVLFNSSFFGPFYPFDRIFEEMQSKKLDFWGLTKHDNAFEHKRGIDEHIQSYFLVINSHLLKSSDFQGFWNRSITSLTTLSEAVYQFEIPFTVYFEKRGYTWDVYVDTARLSSVSKELSVNNYEYFNNLMISELGCPILKRKVFCYNTIVQPTGTMGEDLYTALNYINENTDYDINMIWDNILRSYSMQDLQATLHTDFILPADALSGTEDVLKRRKIAIILYIMDERYLNNCLQYLFNVPKTIDVFVFFEKHDTEKFFAEQVNLNMELKISILSPNGKKRGISSFMALCRKIYSNYEYIAIVPKISFLNVLSFPAEYSFNISVWDNLLKSEKYILNIINTFEQNSKLGLLLTPSPYHSTFFSEGLAGDWGGSYDTVTALSRRLHLRCRIKKDEAPTNLSLAFWARSIALRPLLECDIWEEENEENEIDICEGIKKILVFVAQSEGYYSGTIENTDYASLNNRNMKNILKKSVLQLEMINNLENGKKMLTFEDGKRCLTYYLRPSLICFIKKFRNIYIYGAGEIAKLVADEILHHALDFTGFIVSEHGKFAGDIESMGKPLYFLSEAPIDDCGIILALGEENTKAVLPLLTTRIGTNHVYMFHL